MKNEMIEMTNNASPFEPVFICSALLFVVALAVGSRLGSDVTFAMFSEVLLDLGISEDSFGLVIFACLVGTPFALYTSPSGYLVAVLSLGKRLHISWACIISMGLLVLFTLHLKKKTSYCKILKWTTRQPDE